MPSSLTIVAGLLLIALAFNVSPAYALIIDFNFNNPPSSLMDWSGNGAVQSYMQGLLPLGKTVTVTGSEADNNYTGDNHVVGPLVGTPGTVKPITLGTTDGALGNNTDTPNLVSDIFIMTSGSDRITMTFNFAIDWVQFDWQIFPNGSCPNGGSNGCPNTSDSDWPDFKFEVNDVEILHYYGIDPNPTVAPFIPYNTNTANPLDVTYTRSPLLNPETAPQAIGTTGIIDLNVIGNTTKLEFIDWPVAIGIDNLSIAIVPGPPTMLLVGAGLGLLALARSSLRRSPKPRP